MFALLIDISVSLITYPKIGFYIIVYKLQQYDHIMISMIIYKNKTFNNFQNKFCMLSGAFDNIEYF